MQQLRRMDRHQHGAKLVPVLHRMSEVWEGLVMNISELHKCYDKLASAERRIKHQIIRIAELEAEIERLRPDAERWRRVAAVLHVFDMGGPEYDVGDVFDVIREAAREGE